MNTKLSIFLLFALSLQVRPSFLDDVLFKLHIKGTILDEIVDQCHTDYSDLTLGKKAKKFFCGPRSAGTFLVGSATLAASLFALRKFDNYQKQRASLSQWFSVRGIAARCASSVEHYYGHALIGFGTKMLIEHVWFNRRNMDFSPESIALELRSGRFSRTPSVYEKILFSIDCSPAAFLKEMSERYKNLNDAFNDIECLKKSLKTVLIHMNTIEKYKVATYQPLIKKIEKTIDQLEKVSILLKQQTRQSLIK